MHSKASLVHAVENTLATLTRRIGEKASNMKDVLLLAVVLHTPNKKIEPSLKERRRLYLPVGNTYLPRLRNNQWASSWQTLHKWYQFLNVVYMNLLTCQQIQSNEAILPSGTQAQFTSTPQIPDLSQSSLLATEFNNFETDLFSFDDGSFMWNL
ncbi:hypothetical protein N7476_005429 [Penicillium atrosanguineum]|uniref:Uncharacterized protein n=1 Tax=Penicillium atrosanguineum TaxID=1132637 RepID=A0A9W9U3F8_9EURO|nr:hypothetical protein N7526_008892 [Penicillium atrosanguineum]KAJ5315122.1 hypothetical protein N7476_005429 [Penicillium atrosanguineum]